MKYLVILYKYRPWADIAFRPCALCFSVQFLEICEDDASPRLIAYRPPALFLDCQFASSVMYGRRTKEALQHPSPKAALKEVKSRDVEVVGVGRLTISRVMKKH